METEPRRRPSEGTRPDPKRRRILESARAVFSEQGFDAARMDEVARRARVSKGTVYNHFDSKESLLVECVLDSVAEARESTDALARSGRAPDRELVATLRTQLLDALPTRAGRSQSLFYQAFSLVYQAFSLVARDAKVRDRLFSHFRELYAEDEQRLREGLAAGASNGAFRADLRSEDLVLVLRAIIDGLVYRAIFDPDRIEPGRVLDTLLRLLDGGSQRALVDGGERDDA
jgi:AcrR family transcriptional regulator